MDEKCERITLSISINRLCKRSVDDFMSQLVHIDALSGLGKIWSKENFLLYMPGKWTLSLVAYSAHSIAAPDTSKDKTVIGYCIMSEKSPRCAHIHRLVVKTGERSCGIGTSLVKKAIDTTLVSGKYKFLSLKLPQNNKRLFKFYSGLGFFWIFSENSHKFMIATCE
ncbi:GNAT family N-acetyltransferase [Candidatus Hydrogenosomobacter endosymbioticus]|uniref:N-acetyltransferase domain-containing protein n=1 Tax=Candidatus Hydrogenosomobacter endosymbioticus TaxID=2558174 RepID=A0ABN6L2H5_9PROT|nr:GNAT family N-acetyltransferase [Candidatus Hydrogenosomobacter endosymbioticus]BDB96023.1 hypothetical protein HYD_1560 [Candidatus Hydrogenosomobacter endosymbioticus]